LSFAEALTSGSITCATSLSANWLTSDDWGETGKPVDAQTAKRLNNYVGLVEDRLGAEPLLKFVTKRDKGERVELVFKGPKEDSGEAHQFVFGKFSVDMMTPRYSHHFPARAFRATERNLFQRCLSNCDV
jgi:hypothetical protein